MKTEKGKRYRVIEDSYDFFQKGEIVVALENEHTPFCVRESDYCEGKEALEYKMNICNPLYFEELEKIEGEDYAEDDSEDNLTADIIKNQDEILQYREIGTLDECRAAVEKQKALKPVKKSLTSNEYKYDFCPNCGGYVSEKHYKNCSNCGQKLDWGSEGEDEVN